MAQALARVPALQTAGVKRLINGPEAFTPDGNFILGETPEVEGFYVGAGFNAFGIARAGGAGRALGEWIGGRARPTGAAPAGTAPADVPSFGRPNWFEGVGAEHRAARERVALFDQTSFAKFLLVGKDAEAALSGT